MSSEPNFASLKQLGYFLKLKKNPKNKELLLEVKYMPSIFSKLVFSCLSNHSFCCFVGCASAISGRAVMYYFRY